MLYPIHVSFFVKCFVWEDSLCHHSLKLINFLLKCSYYYQCWKQLCCFIFCFINAFNVTFDQLNASLPIKSLSKLLTNLKLLNSGNNILQYYCFYFIFDQINLCWAVEASLKNYLPQLLNSSVYYLFVIPELFEASKYICEAKTF